MRALLTCLLLFCFPAQASAADLSVTVRTPDGQPAQGAVVTFHVGNGAPAGSIHFDWPYRVAQQNVQFNPRLLIVPVGATVAFPNLDNVRHHVYSFSQGNRFELRLFGQDESRTYTFATAGIAAIGCNIHDRMSAYVIVVDTPYAAITDARGQATFHNVHGAGELRVWRQDIRAPGNQLSRPLTLAEGGAAAQDVVIQVRPGAAPMPMH